MDKDILRLIEIVYWRNHDHCGGDFDKIKCKGEDFGECPDYQFCQLYKELMDKC